ncbi:MAG: putative flagellar-associated protein 172 [Streblomastix strix]|uniref:Putative flagellar-associated protein 172 n=2 Tax=Streblomastix strix TaxID=222440 RepID=A0A5J4VQN1_9EUKA|nr:MAG: putative flagellar-associated protein 172 [Streblomastix strix]
MSTEIVEAADGIDPDAPIIKRVQDVIKGRLEKHIEELRLEKYEKDGEVKKASAGREQIGVELYQYQQDLANKYAELAQLQERFNVAKSEKDKSDSNLKNAQEETDKKHEELSNLQLKVANSQRELDKANSDLMELKQFNETVLGNIAVYRRTTYHTDEALQQQESQKKEQDYLVMRLESELHSLQDQFSLLDAQVVAQQKETENARATLQEANTEKENIQLEERQLLLQYNSTTIGIQRRDEALQQTEEVLHDQKEQIVTLNSEIIGYRHLIHQEEEKSEKNTAILSNVKGDHERLQKRIENAKTTHEKMMEDLGLLKKTVDAVEGDVSRAKGKAGSLSADITTLQKNLQKLQSETIAIEDKISNFLNEKLSFDKFAKATAQKREKMLERVRGQDIEAANVMNELERLKLDILKTQAHTGTLNKALEELLRQLKEKDAIIEKFEVEMRRKNDDIQKKQGEVDKLNRKYDEIMRNKKEEDMGPLEATIYNLSREIEKKKEQCSEMERNWMRQQMSLLALIKTNDHLEGEISDTQAEHTVLSQKKLRLERQIDSEERELHELKEEVKRLYTTMQTLNNEISKRNKNHDTLSAETIDLEARFVNRLQELEEEAVKLEGELDEQRRTHERMNTEIIESERQAMLWNRKIELEKETQSTLDTAGDESDIKEMEEEIHRMELRLDSIRKEEEKEVKKMEQKVMARESIAQKHNASAIAITNKTMSGGGRMGVSRSNVQTIGKTSTAGGMGQTRSVIRAQMKDLQRKIKSIETEAGKTEQEVANASEQQRKLQERVQALAESAKQLREKKDAEQSTTTELLMEKQRNLDKLTRCQRFAKRYEEESKGKWKGGAKKEEVPERMEREKDRKRALDGIIAALREQFPFIHSLE